MAFIGLSGSCWNLAQLYMSLTRNSENNPIDELLNFYKTHLTHSITSVKGTYKDLAYNANPKVAVELAFGGLYYKKESGTKLTIMDLYGALLGAKILIGPDASTQYSD